ALLLPYVGHIVFLSVVFVATRRRMLEAESLMVTLIVALSFALTWSNCGQGFTDTTTHASAASVLLTVRPAWGVFAIWAGLLNDERMLLALPFVFLWHWPDLATIKRRRAEVLWWLGGVGTGTLAYLALRHALTVGWIGPGIQTPEEY